MSQIEYGVEVVETKFDSNYFGVYRFETDVVEGEQPFVKVTRVAEFTDFQTAVDFCDVWRGRANDQ